MQYGNSFPRHQILDQIVVKGPGFMHENGMGKHSGHSGHIPESLPTTRFMLLWHIGTPARSN